nr:acylphosphatase [Anaerolineae bacterium]
MADNKQQSRIARLHARVSGKVQGVGFRAATVVAASDLDLGGWVRNLPDGNVEVLAEGAEKDLREFLAFLSQGPPMAFVTEVAPSWESATGEFTHFKISTWWSL